MDYDLNLFKTFLVLMAEGSVTAASQRLGLTQSAVSGSLRRLRDTFGDPLFTRTRYGIVPTPKAEAIAPIIQKALDDIDAAILGEWEFDPQTSTRKFQIAINSYFECVLVPRLAYLLSQQAPNVRLKVVPIGTDVAEVNLSTGAIDLALGRFDRVPNPLIQQSILHDEFVCVVRANHPEVGDRLTIDDYESMKHVIVSPPSRLRSGVFSILKQQSIQRTVAISVSHFLAVPGAIATTDYCATLPKRIAQQITGGSQYRILSPPTDFGQFPMHIVWHPRHSHDRGHQWLCTLIQGICKEMMES